MSHTEKAKRPKFTLEFKQDAAKLVIEKGYSHQQAADSLGGVVERSWPLGEGGTQRWNRFGWPEANLEPGRAG